jgi:hypothetical protein
MDEFFLITFAKCCKSRQMEDVSEIVAERRTSEKIDYQRSDNTDETEEQQTESEIFSTYQCRSLRFGKEHPGDISG